MSTTTIDAAAIETERLAWRTALGSLMLDHMELNLQESSLLELEHSMTPEELAGASPALRGALCRATRWEIARRQQLLVAEKPPCPVCGGLRRIGDDIPCPQCGDAVPA